MSRAIVLLALTSCATAAVAPPLSDGGGTGGATTTTTPGTGGGGGSDPFDAAPPVDAGPCAPFAETFMPACLACLSAHCCDVAQMCFAVHDCFAYTGCVQNCPPPALDGGSNVCLDACTQNDPLAQPTYGAMTACLHASCAGTCPY